MVTSSRIQLRIVEMADYVRDAFDRAVPGPPILMFQQTIAVCPSKAALLGLVPTS